MTEKLHILVVDDDRRMAKTLVNIFQIKGYQAEAAHSGPEALEKVAEDSFDCVLTDIKMPEVNGVDLYRAIKALQPDSASGAGDWLSAGDGARDRGCSKGWCLHLHIQALRDRGTSPTSGRNSSPGAAQVFGSVT